MLLAGGIGASVLVSAGPAGAQTCLAGVSCSITGTLTLTSGTLSITTPSTLTWAGVVSGVDQTLVDALPADQTYLVSNATGITTGWHVTVSATTFTTTGSISLASIGTFATNGSLVSMTASTAPTATCLSGSTCTLPTNSTAYPVAITTASATPTPYNVFDAATSTGLGSITIGSVGWWLNLPSNTLAGVYTSTILMMITTGP